MTKYEKLVLPSITLLLALILITPASANPLGAPKGEFFLYYHATPEAHTYAGAKTELIHGLYAGSISTVWATHYDRLYFQVPPSLYPPNGITLDLKQIDTVILFGPLDPSAIPVICYTNVAPEDKDSFWMGLMMWFSAVNPTFVVVDVRLVDIAWAEKGKTLTCTVSSEGIPQLVLSWSRGKGDALPIYEEGEITLPSEPPIDLCYELRATCLPAPTPLTGVIMPTWTLSVRQKA